MKSEDVLLKLIKKYGIRRAMTLFGAAAIAAQQGWDALIAENAYTRQGVWTWKRDLAEAGIDPEAVEWSGYERGMGARLGGGLKRAKELAREGRARREARAMRGRSVT